MSVPIQTCRVWRLARGEGTEEEVKRFASDMSYNRRLGIWSQMPCQCKPRCVVPTSDQIEAFEKKVNDYMAEERIAAQLDAKKRQFREPGLYKKIVFPVIENVPDMPVLTELFSIPALQDSADAHYALDATILNPHHAHVQGSIGIPESILNPPHPVNSAQTTKRLADEVLGRYQQRFVEDLRKAVFPYNGKVERAMRARDRAWKNMNRPGLSRRRRSYWYYVWTRCFPR